MKKITLFCCLIILLFCKKKVQQLHTNADVSQVVSEAYSQLKKMESEIYDEVDLSECFEKYPNFAPNGEINGRIYYFKEIIDSAGYKAVWDCTNGGYTFSKK